MDAKTRARLLALIVNRVQRISLNDCWQYQGHTNARGYGTVNTGPDGSGTKNAHRLIYILLNGDPGKGMDVDHLCRNRMCVNPKHLEAVTHRENLIRAGIHNNFKRSKVS